MYVTLSKVKLPHCYIKVMSSYYVASLEFLEAFFLNKKAEFNGEQEKTIIYLHKDRIEKSIL